MGWLIGATFALVLGIGYVRKRKRMRSRSYYHGDSSRGANLPRSVELIVQPAAFRRTGPSIICPARDDDATSSRCINRPARLYHCHSTHDNGNQPLIWIKNKSCYAFSHLRVWVSVGVSVLEKDDDHPEGLNACDCVLCGWNFAADGAEPSPDCQ